MSLNGGFAPDPTGVKDTLRYDLDRLVQAIDADGATRSFVYQPRETSETNPRSFVTKRTFDELADTARYGNNHTAS